MPAQPCDPPARLPCLSRSIPQTQEYQETLRERRKKPHNSASQTQSAIPPVMPLVYALWLPLCVMTNKTLFDVMTAILLLRQSHASHM